MGWKIGGVLTLVLAGVAALVSATTPAEYKTGIEWGIAAIFLVLAVLCFWRGSKASARKKAEQEDRNETYMSDQDLQQIQAGELPVLSSVPVIRATENRLTSSRRRGVISRRRRPSAGPVAAAGSAFALRRACLSVPAAGPVRRSMMTSQTPSPAVWS